MKTLSQRTRILRAGRVAHLAVVILGSANSTLAQAKTRPAPACQITGHIVAGTTPIPGVAVIAKNSDGNDAGATSTSIDGTYRLPLAGAGAYAVRTSIAGFAETQHDVALTAEGCVASLDVELLLQSRAPKVIATPTPTPTPMSVAPVAPTETTPSLLTPPSPSPSPVPSANGERRAGRGQRQGQGQGQAAGQTRTGAQNPPGRRFQDLDVRREANADAPADASNDAADAASQGMPAGFAADAPTESITATAGSQVQTVDSLLFRDRLQLLEESGGDVDAVARRIAQGGLDGVGGFGPGAGGPGGPGGGFGGGGPGGGRGGPGGGFGGGPGGGGRNNRLQGSINYNLSGSPFDARPYALNGKEADKVDYFQHRYGATLGGPLKIPGIYDGSANTSFALTYSGTHTRTPYDAYSTVPTFDERSGDFSVLGRAIIDPLTNQPFPNGVIPVSRLDPAALALLAFIPVPNQPGVSQNFRNVTSTTSSSNEFSLRLNHLFGAPPPPRTNGRTAGQGTGAVDGAARGARLQGARGAGRPGAQVRRRPTLTATLTYRNSSRFDTANFPTVGGATRTSSFDLPVSMSFSTGQIFHQMRFGYNRNRSDGSNLYAYNRDVTGAAGIGGVSRDPFDYGVPSLSFSTVSDLRDRNPTFRLDQRFSFGDTLSRTWKKHTFRAGGEVRLQKLESQTDANARGSFVFTGFYSGLDFADFLLGRPQQASVQFGPGRVRYSSHSENGFLQDDWRVRSNLTLNLGLRYEYVSPYREAGDHLANLDVTPGFTAASPVLAGQAGVYTGEFPTSLVYGDSNNFAPRVGAAWKPKPNLTVRGGFGINYNLGAYSTIVQKLAGQPPFATSQTNLASQTTVLTLANSFGGTPQEATTNTYGIDKNYQLPAVLIWNLDLQRELKGGFIVAASYSGTRGYDLDLLRAPNRSPTGLRIQGVAPFIWESSGATSIMNSITVRARKRLAHGVSGGFSYTLSKSTDNAASIGGGGAVVAQDDTNLEAERGLSSFDKRHRFAGDYLIELPWGQGRKWLREGVLSSLLGGWVWTGTVTIESGSPFTARLVGDIADVARGVNGTLRANVTGQDVALANPTIQKWFNTAAFATPAAGTFGNAGRNTIEGPGTLLVNMGLIKNFNLGRPRVLSVRVQTTNLFNTPQLIGIDTVVNSPTFGQVIRVGTMRTVQFQARFRF